MLRQVRRVVQLHDVRGVEDEIGQRLVDADGSQGVSHAPRS